MSAPTNPSPVAPVGTPLAEYHPRNTAVGAMLANPDEWVVIPRADYALLTRCVRAIAAMQEGRVVSVYDGRDSYTMTPAMRWSAFDANGEQFWDADPLTAIERAASPASREGGDNA